MDISRTEQAVHEYSFNDVADEILSKLSQHDVSGRSEHFVCGFCGGNKMLNIGDGGHGCDECGHYQYTN